MALQTLPLPPCALGESPFWHPHEKRLYWCDILGFSVHAWDPASGQHQQWSTPSEPGCCAPWTAGRLVIGLRDGFYELDTQSGALTCLALLPPAQHDPRVLRLNDGRCDAAGRFWAGSVISPRTAPHAALWRLQADDQGFSVERMAGDHFTANGLAFSPDHRTMYWADTPQHRIDRYTFALDTGTLSDCRTWATFTPRTDGQLYGGRPDGAAVDARGHYWVAMYEGACVVELAPDGTEQQRIPLPVQCPTMVCFGDDDLRTLYITSARQGRPEAEQNATPPAGALFRLRVSVPGLPVAFFGGPPC